MFRLRRRLNEAREVACLISTGKVFHAKSVDGKKEL